MEQKFLENLNKEQLAAVAHKQGPLLIVAGAGTGKTTVITRKIAYLIEQELAKADEILALTFTEKAAQEMEERVDRLLPLGYLDLWIFTFHGFGERILKDHGLEIGLPGGFKLLNEFEQWALVKKNLDKFELDYYRPLGNPTKFIRALIKHFSRAKDENISPAEYLEYAEELKENLDGMLSGRKRSFKSQETNFKQISNLKSKTSNFTSANNKVTKEIAEQEVDRINEVAKAYHVYQQLLLDNNVLDFGDLINYSLKLFRERPAILDYYRQKFKYILLDEFQDTNLAQYELIKILSAPKNNLVVVGDDDQAIYKFRGASVSNILRFKKEYPQAKEIYLIKNYRNKQNILDLAYDFIQQNNPDRLEFQLNKAAGQKPEKTAKISKKLRAENKGRGVIEVITGNDLREEAEQAVEKIAELKARDKKASWNDFAILVRANDLAKEFCSVLDAVGLPYIYLSSRGLFSKPVILDIIAYLKLLDNYHESAAVYRALNMPIFGFSHKDLTDFNYAAKKKAWSLFSVIKNAGSKFKESGEKISKFLSLVEKHTALARQKNTVEVIVAFLEESGYLKFLAGQSEQKSREAWQYLNSFIKKAKAFEAFSEEKDIKSFLKDLEMQIEAGEEGSLPVDYDAGPEAIKIMTMHGAKGLEFKYVFLPGLVDKKFPTIERKEAILIPDALIKEILPQGNAHLQEERRLFYVAVTRAKERLYFSWAPDYGGARKRKPSRFLSEAGLINGREELKPESLDLGLQKNYQIRTQNKKNNFEEESFAYPLPAYYSFTQLTAFKNCPYQYYFAHILKVPTKSKHVFSFGQTMHLTLQRLFELVNEKKGLGQRNLFSGRKTEKQGVIIDLAEIYKLYEEVWIDDWYEDEKSKQEYKKKGREILRDFFHKHEPNWPDVFSLEQSINLKISGRRIYGKIDRIDNYQGGFQLVDYKTGRPKEEGKISLEDKEQLLIYQLAVKQEMAAKQAGQKEIKNLQFYYLDNNSEINFLGREKDLIAMEEKILDRINKIETAVKTKNFPAKPSQLCGFCDFNSICEFRKT